MDDIDQLRRLIDVCSPLLRIEKDTIFFAEQPNAGISQMETPLHIAAAQGHIDMMETLIDGGADVNATAENSAPEIIAAIASGSIKAVTLLLDRSDVNLSLSRSPLEFSAQISEPELFIQVVKPGKDVWKANPEAIEEALIQAAHGGSVHNVRTLLEFHHVFPTEVLKEAMEAATLELDWDCVKAIFDDSSKKGYRGLVLGNVF